MAAPKKTQKKKRRAPGDGCVFQYGSSTPRKWGWKATVRAADGSSFTETKKGYATRAEAAEALRAVTAGRDRGELRARGSSVTLAGWLREWVAQPWGSPETRSTYTCLVEAYLIPALGEVPLAQLTPARVRKGLGSITKRDGTPVSPATLGQAGAVLHAALSRAARDGLIPADPTSSLWDDRPRRRQVQRKKARAWTREQLRAFLSFARDRDPEHYLLYYFLAEMGSRISETLALTWDDVDPVTCRVTFRHAKGGAERDVTMSPLLGELLTLHRVTSAAVPGGTVFGPMTRRAAGSAFSRCVKACAVVPVISTHGLRHTCATLLLRSGVPVSRVAERLGHASPAITWNTYHHYVDDGTQATTAEAMSQIIAGD